MGTFIPQKQGADSNQNLLHPVAVVHLNKMAFQK